MGSPEYAFVQARLQARHGDRPSAETWLTLESSKTPGHYLALARSAGLAHWVQGQGDGGDVHRIEQQLRLRWRRHVDELARWQPARWRAATRWFGGLPELPLIRARGNDADTAHWLDAWLRLMPPGEPRVALLRRVATLLMPRLAGPAGRRRGRDEPPSERAAKPETVQRALLQLFRRHAASPVAVFAHLALVALDLERLRGGLVTRTLFDAAAPPQRTTQEA